ncbi:MAG: hypothetical protein K2W91_10970 [Novosphingobium sp.]|nr:hypothetical protein [Novosphingobium sp.]
MAYDPDPLSPAFDMHFSEIDGQIYFSIPKTDLQTRVSYEQYYESRSKYEYLSGITRTINITLSVISMIAFFWLVIFYERDFVDAAMIMVLVFIINVVTMPLILRRAFAPLYRQIREEQAASNSLPPS